MAGAYQRYLVVTMDQAVIEAPILRIAASAAGTVEAGASGLLRPGDAAARRPAARTATPSVLASSRASVSSTNGWWHPAKSARAEATSSPPWWRQISR